MDLLTYAMAKSNTESEIAEAKQAAETAALSAEESAIKAESAAERAETVKVESDRIANEVKRAAANAAASAEQAQDTVQNVESQIVELRNDTVEEIINRSINVFNVADITNGAYIRTNTGTLFEGQDAYCATDYIRISQGKVYAFFRLQHTNFAFYDSAKSYIQNTINDIRAFGGGDIGYWEYFVAPEMAQYVRMSAIAVNAPQAMLLELNSVSEIADHPISTYIPYHYNKTVDVKGMTDAKNRLNNLETASSQPTVLRVGEYNIQHFATGGGGIGEGTGEMIPLFRKALSDIRCAIIGITENDPYYNKTKGEESKDTVYGMFGYYDSSPIQTLNCNGIVSDFEIKNSNTTQYTNRNQPRHYFECDIEIDGKNIHLMVTHLDFNDTKKRRSQITQLINRAKEFERVIIFGDFNTFADAQDKEQGKTNRDIYLEDYKMFTDAGYVLANAGYFGEINTDLMPADGGSDDNPLPIDNIIVSNNIKIKNFDRIIMEYMDDHCPIFADLVIY